MVTRARLAENSTPNLGPRSTRTTPFAFRNRAAPRSGTKSAGDSGRGAAARQIVGTAQVPDLPDELIDRKCKRGAETRA
jgi:hypothetical protein